MAYQPPRPKALALTILVDWTNQDKADTAAAATGTSNHKRSAHPCWLCVHFGPPPNALPVQQAQQAQMAGQWQLTLNIYSASAEKTPIVKKVNEEPIPKERRAVLWYNTQPFDKHRYAVVLQHCRFPPTLVPRVIAFHADRAEPDANALVWVRKVQKITSNTSREDSYLKVVRGHIYHLHITFPDGSLVNQYIAQGWGFTASLFTYKRRNGHINVSPSRAVTQIRANWLDVVEADPDQKELDEAQSTKFKVDNEEAEYNRQLNLLPLHARNNPSKYFKQLRQQQQVQQQQQQQVQPPAVGAAKVPQQMPPVTPAPSYGVVLPYQQQQQLVQQQQQQYLQQQQQPVSSKSLADNPAAWTSADIDNVVFVPGDTGGQMPGYNTLRALGPEFQLRSEVLCNAVSAASKSDIELLQLFRAVEQRAKTVANESGNKLKDSASRLNQVLSASAQVPGWRSVDEFMHPTAASANAPKRKLEELSDLNQNIFLNAMLRAKWILEVERKNATAANRSYSSDNKTLDRILGALLKDNQWMFDTANFLKELEQQASRLINSNPAAFAKCRAELSQRPQWPHSQSLRQQIEGAGFAFRPTMLKRDRVVCDACGVEVSGWRPWHNPWVFHDRSRAHPFALPLDNGTTSTNSMNVAR